MRLLPEPLPVVNGKTAAREDRALARDPFNVTLRKGIGLPARAAARNRDADAAVGFDAEQIPSRSPMGALIGKSMESFETGRPPVAPTSLCTGCSLRFNSF